MLKMHEQSETIQDPVTGQWINIYGRKTPQAGQPLPILHPYESPSYPNVKAASAAAGRRSRDEGRQQYDPAGPFPGQPNLPRLMPQAPKSTKAYIDEFM